LCLLRWVSARANELPHAGERSGTVALSREVVRVEDLRVEYDGLPVLEDINFTVRERDFVGIIGPNGGGKTTLLKVLLGLLRPTRGRVSVLGRAPQEARGSVGYVPQRIEFDHAFPINVWDVAMMGRLGRRGLLRPYTEDDRRAVENALSQVDMLQHSHRQIGQLSGGERQRVYVARALVSDPEILLLDEPTASVDTRVVGSIYEVLQDLNSRVTILLVSHDIGVVSSYVKTIACLNQRMIYHESKEITPDMLEAAYHCPVDLIAHGLPHRVLDLHDSGE
jgi:zinc transport system ATP-binding protein